MKLEVYDHLSPSEFWDKHIRQRRPCLFSQCSPDLKDLQSAVSLDSLAEHAGAQEVDVEVRGTDAESFGRGRKQRMTVSAFVERLRRGDSSVYLTTQAASVDADGHPALLAPPLAALPCMPLVPAVLGALVPQSINLWAGCAPHGASSGLHHDFHDNLYVLLQGSKRFRLFPPSLARRMYTNGDIDTVHPNGRIMYKGSGAVNADGSDPADVRAWRCKHAADTAAAANSDSDGGGSSADDAQEAALASALDAFQDGEISDDCSDLDSAEGSQGGSDDSNGATRAEAVLARLSDAAPRQERGNNGCKRDTGAAGMRQQGSAESAAVPSFSQVDMTISSEARAAQFPDFPERDALEATLTAGQMLYMPAGWFHEVTSCSASATSPHIALNFWMHPPDSLGRGDAARPYANGFWPALWSARVARHGWPQALLQPLQSAPDGGGSGSPCDRERKRRRAGSE